MSRPRTRKCRFRTDCYCAIKAKILTRSPSLTFAECQTCREFDPRTEAPLRIIKIRAIPSVKPETETERKPENDNP